MRFLTAGALLVSMTVACSEEPNVVPVQVRTGYLTKTDMTPVRVELYEYIESERNEFRVRPGPPLAFKFPAAYYADGLSLKGGPVASVSLEIDRQDWKPFSLLGIKTSRTYPPDRAAEIKERRLRVEIYSNYLTDDLPADAPPRESTRMDILWLGMEVFSSTRRDGLMRYGPTRAIIDGIDLNNMTYYAYNKNALPGQISHITCRYARSCRARLYYFGRRIDIKANDLQLPDIHAIAENLVTFLDKFRVTAPSTGRERSPKYTINVVPPEGSEAENGH